jgi:hypothetical protein
LARSYLRKAVDSETGEVGTKTLAHFHTRYLGLVARCEAELQGSGQLFPPPSRTSLKRPPIPKGELNLSFGAGSTSAFEMEEDDEDRKESPAAYPRGLETES